MSRLKTKLARLESRLQSLIEGSAARLFPLKEGQSELLPRLVAAMKAGVRAGPDGALLAPNLYTIMVHPDHVQILQEDSALLEELANLVLQSGMETGLHFTTPPVIKIAANPAEITGQVNVMTQISSDQAGDTNTMALEVSSEGGAIPNNAFLIIGGTQVFPLTQAVLNLGRRVDNHLVVEDPRVSRVHCQLRAIRGRYVIFDLGSSGGTFINGELVKQCTLHPGDVVSLAGFPLIYGQDTFTFSGDALGTTHPLVPYPPER